MAAIGSVIDNKYEILTLVGTGGMSRVYLARDNKLNRQLAIKEVEKKTRDKNNEIVIQSAIAEANILKNLGHVGLAYIVDIIETPSNIYIVMEYVEGESLDKVLDEFGAQPQDLVIEWAKQLCVVLEYLHTRKQPIIYRDMKPANIRLKPDGNLKLIDFGIAREYKEQNLADTVSLGTKGYAAPEQFGGKGQTDARTDVYCLGVTLYHLVTGQNPAEPPYELYPIRHWNLALSGGLERIIQKCTQQNPDERYQTCADLLYALEHYEEIDDVYRDSQKKKLRSFIIVAAASVLSLIIGVTGMIMRTATNNADYANNVGLAEKAATDTEKANYYRAAIDIKPSVKDAYLGLIDAFKYDAEFSVAEEEQLKVKINANLTTLKETSDYADLAFEIGKLYWYYFDYGKSESSDNQITRMKSSIQWFEDAVQYGSQSDSYYQMATIYRDIGKFNRDITLNIEEASDKGIYQPYFANIQELLTLIENSPDESEIVPLELYRLTIYSIETYARKFKADGLTGADLQAVFDRAKQGVQAVSATTEKTEEIQNSITGRFEAAQKAITNAYANG
jgi:serine/threonine-protein kinase